MSESTPVSLASLITPSKTVTVEFPGYDGVSFDLTYLGKDEMIKLRKKCVHTKFNKRTHLPEETLDEDLFVKLYCKAVIQGWSGLKYKYLEELLLVDVSALDQEDELPFTVANAEELMKNSAVIDSWVTDAVGDLENFTKDK